MLHYRATREVFDAARQLCAGKCPQEKILGANILGQLGVPDRTFPEESVAILIGLLDVEKDEYVMQSACIALGHIRSSKAIPSLSRLKSHLSADVRYAVVYGLLGLEDDLAIKMMIDLSKDADDRVRDWATFGLGSLINADSPQIREALFARLLDSDEGTRGEALVGLARRKDQRIVELLLMELNRFPEGEYGRFGLEAVEDIGDPRFLPEVTRLKRTVAHDDTTFDEAIRRCTLVAS